MLRTVLLPALLLAAGLPCALAQTSAPTAPASESAPGLTRDAQTGKLMVEARYVCPVNGEAFTESQRAAVYQAGTYLDLKPYGSFDGEFPPLPACPGNGLVMVRKTYTPQEVEKLRAFMAEPDFARLRDQETRAYMAARQVAYLGDAPARVADRWLKATWSARNPDEYRRYAEQALQAMQRLAEQSDKPSGSWITGQLSSLELERRLGRFEAAQARLQALRSEPKFQEPFFVQLLALQGELIERRDASAQKMPARKPAAAAPAAPTAPTAPSASDAKG